MLKRPLKIFLGLLLLAACARADDQAVMDISILPDDRVLVMAPHPDDEVLGTGGVLQRAVAMKVPIKVVFFTYGDSNQWSFLLYRRHPVIMPGAVEKMGLVRRDEAMAASSILGVTPENLVFLGYPDFGTMNIWYAHWNDRPPLRGMMTRAAKVPYEGAFRPGALYKGEEIVNDLRAILKEFKPTKIFISHPSDHNGDHLSLYLFTRVALWDEDMEDKVQVYPYLVHYLGWPKPFGFHPDKMITPPESLKNIVHWEQYVLTPQEVEVKKKALQAHRSQYDSTPKYLLSFVRGNELFGSSSTIHLHPNENSPVFVGKRKFVPSAELPEELNTQEKTAFIGVKWKFLRWEGQDLVISIELSRPLAQNVEAFIYIFGYNKTTPFKAMPKISVRLGFLSYNVYDQARRIDQSSVKVKRTSNEVTINVPLKLLGHPDRVLTSAHTYLGNVPLDSSSWVAVELY